MKKIFVESFIAPLGTGITVPSLILGDDNQQYILKKQRESEMIFDSMFVNEVVAHNMAKYLEIPIPECAIAEIEKELVDMDRDIIFVHQFREGQYFASQKVEDIENNILDDHMDLLKMGKPYLRRTWNDFFKGITNKKDIAKIIVFDMLIANFDRFGNSGNFLISDTGTERTLYVIDHGHAFFGANWNMTKMNYLRGYNSDDFIVDFIKIYLNPSQATLGQKANLGEVFKAMEQHVDLTDVDNHDFMEIVEKVENLDRQLIRDFFNDIPDEWFQDKNTQINYFVDFLMIHKENIKIILQYFADHGYFTNYRGGALVWKQNVLKDATQ
ncbi:HipA family kinase [Macrococcus bovicus]|uniref:HipA family kinase n=1 Tax=Macrococcus bovicus TaxID=69968 RepID=UPI0025A559FE|nr:HipA family kinase [Macrococcus bovicus]WJP98448.1 hypothetical protein QSV55_03855 [Macrococcus bovicus]